jgi:hypothetical protein
VLSAIRIVHSTNGHAAAAVPGVIRIANGAAKKSCKSMADAATKAVIGRAAPPAAGGRPVRSGNVGIRENLGGNALITR